MESYSPFTYVSLKNIHHAYLVNMFYLITFSEIACENLGDKFSHFRFKWNKVVSGKTNTDLIHSRIIGVAHKNRVARINAAVKDLNAFFGITWISHWVLRLPRVGMLSQTRQANDNRWRRNLAASLSTHHCCKNIKNNSTEKNQYSSIHNDSNVKVENR